MTVPAVAVFDFDGTVCLGDGPVFAYAEELAARIGDPARRRRLLDGVSLYFERTAEGALAREPDGYRAVQFLARQLGVAPEEQSSAYLASRERVGSGAIGISAPEGLRPFLTALRERARIVLVTNAPHDSTRELLDLLGVGQEFDEVHGEARKPGGMTGILAELLERHGIRDQPRRLLSVGDVWENDLAPAAALGATTAFVDRWSASPEATPDFRAATLPGLYASIQAWSHQNW